MWVNLKKYFTNAYQELRDTDTTINKLGFHSANNIVPQIVKQLRAEVPEETEYVHSALPEQLLLVSPELTIPLLQT